MINKKTICQIAMIPLLFIVASTALKAGLISRPYNYVAGADILAPENNANENTLYNEFNGQVETSNLKDGTIIDADINAAAAIQDTKFDCTTNSDWDLLTDCDSIDNADAMHTHDLGTIAGELSATAVSASNTWGGFVSTDTQLILEDHETRLDVLEGTGASGTTSLLYGYRFYYGSQFVIPSQFVTYDSESYVPTGRGELEYNVLLGGLAASMYWCVEFESDSTQNIELYTGWIDDNAYYYINGSLAIAFYGSSYKDSTDTISVSTGTNYFEIVLNSIASGPPGGFSLTQSNGFLNTSGITYTGPCMLP